MRPSFVHPTAVLAVTLAVTLAAGCRAPATLLPEPAASGAYIVTLGNDTISAESYTRTGDRIDGIVMRRVPRTVLVRYSMTPGPTGLPARLEYNTRLPDGALVPGGAQSISVTFTPDSAITRITRDSVVTVRVAARNAYPEIDGAVSPYALPIAALRRMGVDSASFMAYAAGASSGSQTPVARRGGNSYWLYSFGSPIEVRVDDQGQVLSVDAERTTFRIRSQRQPTADVVALAREFARREAIAGPITALSPRDTARANVAGAQITVDYGRPATRGRRIWGPNGVLGDTLWRTGANQDTRFRTDVPLTIGGRTLPAGTYTLMTLAVPGRYQLIFYDDGAERLRVPLQSISVSPSVERFTIVIDSTGGRSGVIRLRWDTMELTAPFAVP